VEDGLVCANAVAAKNDDVISISAEKNLFMLNLTLLDLTIRLNPILLELIRLNRSTLPKP
jgi:hypothetical protein